MLFNFCGLSSFTIQAPMSRMSSVHPIVTGAAKLALFMTFRYAFDYYKTRHLPSVRPLHYDMATDIPLKKTCAFLPSHRHRLALSPPSLTDVFAHPSSTNHVVQRSQRSSARTSQASLPLHEDTTGDDGSPVFYYEKHASPLSYLDDDEDNTENAESYDVPTTFSRKLYSIEFLRAKSESMDDLLKFLNDELLKHSKFD